MNELLNEIRNDPALSYEQKISLLGSWIAVINGHVQQTIMTSDELKDMIERKNLIEAVKEELSQTNQKEATT